MNSEQWLRAKLSTSYIATSAKNSAFAVNKFVFF